MEIPIPDLYIETGPRVSSSLILPYFDKAKKALTWQLFSVYSTNAIHTVILGHATAISVYIKHSSGEERVNSLDPGRCSDNSISIFFKLIVQNTNLGTPYEIALRRMSQTEPS